MSLERLFFSAVWLCPAGLGLGLFLGAPWVGLLGAVLILLLWQVPMVVFFAFILIAPINRSPHSQYLSPHMLVFAKAIFVLILGGIWAVRRGAEGASLPFPSGVKAVLIGWGALAVLSSMAAQNPILVIPHVVVCVSGVVLFWIVWRLPAVWDRKIWTAVVFSALAVAGISLLQYAILHYRILPVLWPWVMSPKEQGHMQLATALIETPLWRVAGTFMHANALGTFLMMMLPFVCASLFVEEFSARQRALSAVVFVFLLAALYATNSRASVVGTGVAFVYLAMHRGFRGLRVLGITVLFGVGLYALMHQETFVERFRRVSRMEYGFSSRGMIWERAMELAKQNPWLGVGPGNFSSQYSERFGFFVYDNYFELVEQARDLQVRGQELIHGFHAHNTLLQVAAEYGVAGVPLFLLTLFIVIGYAERKSRRMTSASFERAMALGLSSFCVGYLVACHFDSYVGFTEMGLLSTAPILVALGLRHA